VLRARPLPEFPLVALARLRDAAVAVGDTIGSLTVVDVRAGGRELKGRRGFVGCPAGAVQICPHPRLPLFGVLSWDRLLRLYDVERPAKVAVKCAFVRTRGTCVALMDDDVPVEPASSEDEWAQLPESGPGIWDDFRLPGRAGKGDGEDEGAEGADDSDEAP
jgi:hypothetical protein